MVRLEIIGNLGRDAEEKDFDGVKYAAFSVCHTEKRGDNEYTTWVNVLKKDENGKLLPHLKKGTKVWVSGSPKAKFYTTKEGQVVVYLHLTAFFLEFCGGKKENEDHSYTQGSPMGEVPASEQPDDLPF